VASFISTFALPLTALQNVAVLMLDQTSFLPDFSWPKWRVCANNIRPKPGHAGAGQTADALTFIRMRCLAACASVALAQALTEAGNHSADELGALDESTREDLHNCCFRCTKRSSQGALAFSPCTR
jgi:hypothetical protein